MIAMTPSEKPWHEKERFWEDNPFPEKVIKMAEKEVSRLIELVGSHEGMKVLDLCCGVGRHSI